MNRSLKISFATALLLWLWLYHSVLFTGSKSSLSLLLGEYFNELLGSPKMFYVTLLLVCVGCVVLSCLELIGQISGFYKAQRIHKTTLLAVLTSIITPLAVLIVYYTEKNDLVNMLIFFISVAPVTLILPVWSVAHSFELGATAE